MRKESKVIKSTSKQSESDPKVAESRASIKQWERNPK
jgi:hypothetical protein